MRVYQVEGYSYLELSDKAKQWVKYWLDEFPFDYEDEEGVTLWDYPSDWADSDINEHCECNGYIFDKFGKPLHNIILDNQSLAA